MNTEKQTTASKTNPELKFKRRAKVGFNVLDLKSEKGQTNFIKVEAYELFNSKDGRQIPYWNVANLETGETGMVWVDGGMKGQFSRMGGPEQAVGRSFEITFTGQKRTEIDGEDVNINTYEIYELDPR